MRSNRMLVMAYLVRHTRLWILVRLLVSALFLRAGEHPLRIALGGVGWLVALSAAVNGFEMYRRHEFDFLGNLGVSRTSLMWWAIVPPLLGESVLLAFRP